MNPIVVCVGLTTLDVVQWVDALPQPNQKVVATDFNFDLGGCAANAARVAVALGCHVRLVTALGDSDLARLARSRLAGVQIIDVAPPDHPLAVSSVLVTPDGARAVVSRNTQALPAARIPQGDVLADAAVVLHDGHLLAASVELAERQRPDAKTLHLLDGGSWKRGLERLLPFIDIAVVSADFRVPGGRAADSLNALTGFGIPMLARSRGADPVQTRVKEEPGEIPVPQVEAVDTLAAGDVLHGALAAYLALGQDFITALTGAVAIASLSVTGPGAMAWQHSA